MQIDVKAIDPEMMAVLQQLRPLRSSGPRGLLRPSGKLTVYPLCYNRHPRGKPTLTNLSGIVKQLKKERDRLHQQLSGLNAALEAFAGVYRGSNGSKPRRKLSAKGQGKHRGCAESSLGESEGDKSDCRQAGQTNDVGLGSAKDRSSTGGEVGQGQAGKENGLKCNSGRAGIFESFLGGKHPTVIS